MAWSKIKSIVLLILVALNVVLLIFVYTRAWAWEDYQREGREYTIALLESHGIEYLPEETPTDGSLYTLNVTWDGLGEAEDTMAYALLGDYEKESQTGDIQVTYTSSLGSADFYSSGLFQITLEAGNIRTAGMTFEGHSVQMLEDMGLEGGWKETSHDGNTTIVTYYQVWQGETMFSCQLNFTYEGAYLCGVQGLRVAGSATAVEGEELPTFSTALVLFLGGVTDGTVSIATQITAMTWGYQATLTRPIATLTPAWCITTDTGIYYIDTDGITVG